MRLLLLFTGCVLVESALHEDAYSKKTKDGRLNPMEIERVKQIHYGWYVQAVSALLGAMGKEMYMKMNRKSRKAFIACLDAVENEHDIKNGAKCLVKAFDGKLISSFPEALYSPQFDFIGKDISETKFTGKRIKYKQEMKVLLKSKAMKILKIKEKKMKQRPKYKKPKRISMSMESMESSSRRWYSRRIRRHVLSLYNTNEAKAEARRVDKMDSPWKVKTLDRTPSLINGPLHKSPVRVVTEFLGGIVRLVKNETAEEQRGLQQSYKKLIELQNLVSEKQKEGQFKHRMLDMVLGKNHPLQRKKTFTEKFRDLTPNGLVDKSVLGLVESVSKHTKDLNYNLLSPRFFPLLPDKYSNKKPILSPNLFPLYKDDSDNSILPIPQLLDDTGIQEKDKTSILKLILDASGVNEVVDDALKIVKNVGATGVGKDIMDISSTIDGTFMDLYKTFTSRQKKDISSRDYTFLNKEQLHTLYGENGIYNNSIMETPFDIDEYGSMDHKSKEESLKLTVRMLAGQKPRRFKRTLEFNVLGPTVISPNIFSPSIISPLLLSPPVISPQVGDPLVLSPYFLGPNVLSAAVFNAYVLSPYVLSPNVINPYVLSPLILSPYVLCPDVLSPTILSGAILSPSVASPAVFTESALAAAVLSPSIFS